MYTFSWCHWIRFFKIFNLLTHFIKIPWHNIIRPNSSHSGPDSKSIEITRKICMDFSHLEISLLTYKSTIIYFKGTSYFHKERKLLEYLLTLIISSSKYTHQMIWPKKIQKNKTVLQETISLSLLDSFHIQAYRQTRSKV